VCKWTFCVNGFYLTERHSAPSARHRQRARGWIQHRSCSIVVVVVMVVVVVTCGVVLVGVVAGFIACR